MTIQHIGITGNARHGKDTFAKFLRDHLQLVTERSWRICSLMDPVKEHLGRLMGFTWEQMHTDQIDVIDSRWGCTPRHALQIIVTDLLKKQFDPLFLFKIPDCPLRSVRVIIPNVRNPEEGEAIQKLGGIVIRIVRPDAPKLDDKAAAHETERTVALVHEDLTIMNNGTLVDLEERAESWVHSTHKLLNF